METAVEKLWDQFPMYMSVSDIATLGFKKTVIYGWLRTQGFPPVIKENGYRVNKFKFRAWLESKEGLL